MNAVNFGEIPPPPPLPPKSSYQEGSDYAAQSDNFVQEYVQFFNVHNMSKTNLHPMSITSENELPHIKLYMGLGNSNTAIGVSFLYDTGATLNTGFCITI